MERDWIQMNLRLVGTLILFFLTIGNSMAQDPGGKRSGPMEEPLSNPYMGAVPSGKASADSIPLTLTEAIRLGLERNLGTILSSQKQRTARGERMVALSQLLPNLSGRITESSQQINLAAFGFPPLPGIPQIIGPFGVFDARGELSQTILNFRSLNNSKASVQNIKAAEFSFKDARDTVVLVVATLYMQAVAAASRIEAAKAQLDTAEALYRQATDMKAAGVVPAIDVLRAQVELQSQRQRFIAYQNEFEKGKLHLVRVIGLPDGQDIRLTDTLPTIRPQEFNIEGMIQKAYQSRMDYRELEARVRTTEYVRKAAHSELFPSLSFQGDYGTLGTTPGSSHGTYLAAVSLNFPIFSGGRIRGEELEADALLARQRAQLEELKARIGFEVRGAMLDLKSASERVEVNQSAVDLAKEQDLQARDRFAAGVANNLEVVQAQEALARANDSYISSLYSYNVAKVFLARAIGETEKNLGAWLLGVNH